MIANKADAMIVIGEQVRVIDKLRKELETLNKLNAELIAKSKALTGRKDDFESYPDNIGIKIDIEIVDDKPVLVSSSDPNVYINEKGHLLYRTQTSGVEFDWNVVDPNEKEKDKLNKGNQDE